MKLGARDVLERQWIPTAISNLTTLQSGRLKTILGHILLTFVLFSVFRTIAGKTMVTLW